MANKHTKSCSTWSTNWNIKYATTKHTSEWLKLKMLTVSSVDKNTEQLKLSYIVSETMR